MFTGIIEEIGVVRECRQEGRAARLTVAAQRIMEDIRAGDSISVDGVCLTVHRFTAGSFTADVMPETLARTGLGALKPGSRVNLERAVKAGGRFGGHFVSGHIDGTGRIESHTPDQNAEWFRINAPAGILKYIAEKGSVAIDGISLTVVSADPAGFTVSVIPHTQQETTLSGKRAGDTVNIECDLIARYVERLTPAGRGEGRITDDFLRDKGFLD